MREGEVERVALRVQRTLRPPAARFAVRMPPFVQRQPLIVHHGCGHDARQLRCETARTALAASGDELPGLDARREALRAGRTRRTEVAGSEAPPPPRQEAAEFRGCD